MDTTYRHAGFWVRVVAALIDSVIIAAIGFIVRQIIGDSDPITIIIGAGYHIGMWVKNDGMTFGKKVMGIKVIQTNGQAIDIKTGVIRYIGYIVSGMVLGIGFIWVAFDKNKQGWHDKIANTFVIYK
ncbi:RDD family protein [Candidatus Woesebacteria bacterium]|nr:RDD family protein [Candidatus Woesebacteria bacterium]